MVAKNSSIENLFFPNGKAETNPKKLSVDDMRTIYNHSMEGKLF